MGGRAKAEKKNSTRERPDQHHYQQIPADFPMSHPAIALSALKHLLKRIKNSLTYPGSFMKNATQLLTKAAATTYTVYSVRTYTQLRIFRHNRDLCLHAHLATRNLYSYKLSRFKQTGRVALAVAFLTSTWTSSVTVKTQHELRW